MSEMEIESGLMDPTDPVDCGIHQAKLAAADLRQVETPPHASEMEPIMTSSPVTESGGGAATPTEETQEDSPQDIPNAKPGDMSEEPQLSVDQLQPQEMEVASNMQDTLPSVACEMKEKLGDVAPISFLQCWMGAGVTLR